MPEEAPRSRRSMRAQSSTTPRNRRVWAWAISGAILIVLIGAAAWVGTRGLQAKAELEAAQSQIGTLKTQALAFDIAGAKSTLAQVRKHTDEAANLTGDPVWRAAEFVPFAGPNLSAVRELAEITDTVISDVALPLLQVAAPLNPEKLLAGGASIDPKPIIDAIPAVTSANEAAQSALKQVRSVNTEGTLPQLVAARAKIADLLNSVAPTLKIASDTLPLVPGFLGVDSPRTYVVMFQNNAELRSLGGTALSFAQFTVTGGHLELVGTFPAGQSAFQLYPESVIPIPDGAAEIYPEGSFGTYIANATLRPDFPTAANIVSSNWEQSFGLKPDGIFSLDPIALSYFFRASEPLLLSSGDLLSSESLVGLMLNEAYLRFDSGDYLEDNLQQDRFYAEVVDATFNTLMSGALKPKLLIEAATQAIDERRLLFWSPDQAEQALYSNSGLDGGLPRGDANKTRAGLYVEDAVGSKLNYYLDQSIETQSAQCRPDETWHQRVSLSLRSSVPLTIINDLNPSILGKWKREGLDPGVQRLNVMFYAPPNTTITSLEVDGEPRALDAFHDEDHPVAKTQVELPPSGETTIAFVLATNGTTGSELEVQHTPLVRTTPVTSSILDCSMIAQ